MPPRGKSMTNIVIETILFISLFSLAGHLSVNFWERFVIQSELSKMKTSLNDLKETINHVFLAYNHLYKELRDLADMAESGDYKNVLESYPFAKSECDFPVSTARALIQDVGARTNYKGYIDEENEKSNAINKNIQTQRNIVSPVVVQTSTQENETAHLLKKQINKKVGVPETRNKKIQHGHTQHKSAILN